MNDTLERPTWDWPELLASYLVSQLVPSLVFYLLLHGGFLAQVYGPDRVAAVPLPSTDAARFGLWCVVLAFPLQVAAVLGLLWHTQRVTFSQLGLPGSTVARQLRDAVLLAVVLVPVVYGVYALALVLSARFGVVPVEHGFTRLAREGLSPTEAILLVLAACVVAPLWEELFFRGLIQPWLIAQGWRGQVLALTLAVAVAALHGRTPAVAACVAAAGTSLWPASWRGVYAVAVLFAFVHSAAWPSPLPLLLLGVGLGALARRGGLLGPILLHAMFNALACCELFFPFLPKLQ
jgi:membrane protease YdiL (CAAX protease family)